MESTEKMNNLIAGYLNEQKNLEFSIMDLENYVINIYESLNAYSDDGGYSLFYSLIRKLEASSQITPVKSSAKITNNRRPFLPIRWRKVKTKALPSWTDQQLLQVADRVDISHFAANPEKQDEKTWKHILSIHRFLGERDQWEWESKASRSYQLFQDEKFLNDEGKKLGY